MEINSSTAMGTPTLDYTFGLDAALGQDIYGWGDNASTQGTTTMASSTGPGDHGNPVLITTVFALIFINLFFNCHFGAALAYFYRGNLRPSQLLVLNLGVSSLVFVVSYFPILLLLEMRGKLYQCQSVCRVFLGLEAGLVCVIIWSATLASLNHYAMVKKQSEYDAFASRLKLSLSTLSVWILGVLMACITGLLLEPNQQTSGVCSCQLQHSYNGVVQLFYSACYISVAFILPITLMLIFYGLTIMVVWRQIKRRLKNPFHHAQSVQESPTSSEFDSESTTTTEPGQPKSAVLLRMCGMCASLWEVKDVQVAALYTAINLVCFLPHCGHTLLSTMERWQTDGSPYYVHCALLFLLFSSANFHWLIYVYNDHKLQLFLYKFYMQLFRLVRHKAGAPATNNDNSSCSISLDEETGTSQMADFDIQS